jgi:hypothetical protein
VVEVVGDQLCPLGEGLACHKRVSRLVVQAGPLGARQRAIGDVLDQLVAEGVAAGVGGGALLDQSPAPQRPEQVTRVLAEEVLQRALREGVPEDGRDLKSALLLGREQVDPSRDRGLHGVGQALRDRLLTLVADGT